jgi:hypothetical protein
VTVIGAFLSAFGLSNAGATVIVSPSAVLSNTLGTYPCCGYTVESIRDQSGLATGFTSGTTDFDAYLATNPLHTTSAFLFEWFSPHGVTSGSIVLDLGSQYIVDRFALWNEEYAGVDGLTVDIASDAGFTSFSSFGLVTPTDHPTGGLNYAADVFAFTPTSGRYLRLNVSGVITALDEPSYNGVGIGEVAFSVSPVEAVPEPGTLLLLATGLSGFALRRRRRG